MLRELCFVDVVQIHFHRLDCQGQGATHFYPFALVFLRVRPIFTLKMSYFHGCNSFLPFWPTFTSATHCYYFEPCLQVLQIFTFSALFTSATHFYHFETCSGVRLVFTILSHFYQCDPFFKKCHHR